MYKPPFISTSRMVSIFEEMVSLRREICPDNHFFKMTTVWDDLCDEQGNWKVKKYRSKTTEAFKRKAALCVFDDRAILSVDEQLYVDANNGCMLSNFMLAHEFGHAGLNHFAKSAVIKHFQLFASATGMRNLPPTVEEREANYAAVFFQCGIALFDMRWTALELAKRACSDPYYVGQAQIRVRTDAFLSLLHRPKPVYPRVIL